MSLVSLITLIVSLFPYVFSVHKAHSACVLLNPPDAWEGEVQSCTDVKGELLRATKTWFSDYSDAEILKLADQILKNRPGILITLLQKKSRQYEIDHDSTGNPIVVWTGDWKSPAKPKTERFFWTGKDANCGKIKKNQPKQFLIRRPCCDVFPPVGTECLLDIANAQTIDPKNEQHFSEL